VYSSSNNDGYSATIKYNHGVFVEKSLAVDNIFVIAMIFGFFAVRRMYQHRVLFLGNRRGAVHAEAS